MEPQYQKMILGVRNMTCPSCENRIRQKLEKIEGVSQVQVSWKDSSVTLLWQPEKIQPVEIHAVLHQMNYPVVLDKGTEQRKKLTFLAGGLLILGALYWILSTTGILDLFYHFPQADENMAYGLLFLVGLFTSVHCVAMCGGIGLSQSLSAGGGDKGKWTAFLPSLKYNLGRVVSYTVLGGIIGGLGSVFQLTAFGKGIIQLVAGVFMLIMGLNMLQLFPSMRRFQIRMPGFLRERFSVLLGGNGPFWVGILNGLMPCGPLQAMQLYALSTGSVLKGALAMFLFSMGTVPLMLGMGSLFSLANRSIQGRLMHAGALLVLVLGISMMGSGIGQTGFVLGFAGQSAAAAEITENVQVITTNLSSRRYEPITVQAGIPVQWTIQAPEGSLNGCNYYLYSPGLGFEKMLQTGENLIEFTPLETGTYGYSCWMGMIRSTVTVVEPGEEIPEQPQSVYPLENDFEDGGFLGGSCC